MKKFNLQEYLKTNKLTKSSIIIEGKGAYEFEKGKKEGEKIEKDELKEEGESCEKMTKSKFKDKIKEMIIAELSNDGDDEDFEKASREIEFGINGETGETDFDLKDFFDTEEDIDENKSKEWLDKVNGDDVEIDEAKKNKDEEEEEEVNIEDLDLPNIGDDENIDIDNESNPEGNNEFNVSTSEVDPTIKAVQDALTQAQSAAAKLGDEKLTDQIGNTITFFTREHIANKPEQGTPPMAAEEINENLFPIYKRIK